MAAMSDQEQDFETELARIYATGPILPDGEAFAARVAHGAGRRARLRNVVVFSATGLGAMIAAAQISNAGALQELARFTSTLPFGGHIGGEAAIALAGAALAVYASLRVAEG
jgi:hypothetical protein